MRVIAAGDPGPWRQQAMLGRGRWDADALRDIVRDYAVETLGPADAVLVIDDRLPQAGPGVVRGGPENHPSPTPQMRLLKASIPPPGGGWRRAREPGARGCTTGLSSSSPTSRRTNMMRTDRACGPAISGQAGC